MAEMIDFIDQVINQDFTDAGPTFADIMQDKMDAALEQEKVRVADMTFNGAEEPEDPADGDQYEMDLDEPIEDDVDELEDDAEEVTDADAEEALDMEMDEEESEAEEEE